MKLLFTGKSDPGLKHTLNEDHFLLAPELGLYAIADGMGGHRGGELASRMVVETLEDYWRTMKEGRPPTLLPSITGDLSEQGKHLINSIMMCNLMIHEFQKKARYHRMGSTVSALLQERDFLWVANVGDSPVFLFDRGRLTRISEEHTVAEEQRAMGISEPPGAFNPLLKNILTRVLGLSEKVKVYANTVRPEPGDFILMCSDGLSKFVPEPAIKTILGNGSISIQRKVDDLVDEANRGGGGDNITAVLLEVAKEGKWVRFRKRLKGKGSA